MVAWPPRDRADLAHHQAAGDRRTDDDHRDEAQAREEAAMRLSVRDAIEVVSMAAEKMIAYRGYVRPTFFIGIEEDDGETGLNICPAPHHDKDLSIEIIRALLAVTGAKFYVFVDEAWVVEVHEKTPEQAGEVIPSEHPDRFEVVMISGEDSDQQVLAQRPIIRDTKGTPSLGPIRWITDEYGAMEKGRLVGLMPPSGTAH
jgi:hypothetical protein